LVETKNLTSWGWAAQHDAASYTLRMWSAQWHQREPETTQPEEKRTGVFFLPGMQINA